MCISIYVCVTFSPVCTGVMSPMPPVPFPPLTGLEFKDLNATTMRDSHVNIGSQRACMQTSGDGGEGGMCERVSVCVRGGGGRKGAP